MQNLHVQCTNMPVDLFPMSGVWNIPGSAVNQFFDLVTATTTPTPTAHLRSSIRGIFPPVQGLPVTLILLAKDDISRVICCL